MQTYHYIVDEATQGTRLDQVVATQLSNYSRTYCKELITSNCVQINGTVAAKPSRSVKTGDLIEIRPELLIPSMPLTSTEPLQDVGVEILYEHDEFLIVYKPAGLVVHTPHAKSTEVTLVDHLVHRFLELSKVGSSDRPGIVHRLDKDTSGIMIIPRNNQAHLHFSQLFHDRKIEKVYQAFVAGHPEKEGFCDEPLGRHPIHRHKMAVTLSGRPSQTRYVVERYFKEYALLLAYPTTGRTHQIRVHCAALGFPIVGDTTYGSPSKRIARQALHAYQLTFTYKNRWYSFIYSMPEEMRSLLID